MIPGLTKPTKTPFAPAEMPPCGAPPVEDAVMRHPVESEGYSPGVAPRRRTGTRPEDLSASGGWYWDESCQI